MNRIYVDNAATTKPSRRATEVLLDVMENNYANPSSLHTPGQLAAVALADSRRKMAEILGCEPREIIFTSGGSEADNQAILTGATLGLRKGKKHIVSTKFEHHAVLHTLQKLEKQGFEVTYLDVHSNGMVRLDELEASLREDTALVTIMYANNEIGSIQPVRQIGEICRKHGVLFHTDAVQAVGHLPVNVQEDNIDMLSLSAHKFHGPKGVGALYIRKGIAPATLIEGGAQERGKRAGTENLPAIASMAAALEEAVEKMDEYNAKLTAMRDRLIEGISKIPHSTLTGDAVERLPGCASFCFEGIEGEALLLLLDQKGICASSGSACTSGSLDPSHVLLAIGLPHEVAHGSLRLSLSHENTMEEMDTVVQAVTDVVAYLRSISPVWADLQKGTKEYVIQ
ncbi:MAG: IscS subfamily cysteine desulfurase [Candidatus Fournierella pullistercoris]|uniref:cysteine desulfurase n=1 Tax=Candidatus Allofournierella pullistercoris TaxID=2838597 RepID=A0A948T235_9FIRM|nr:IscS subfamily cysteine desulfurase [Candidatus Fournierella pullistercoris]